MNSMTGIGCGECTIAGRKVTVEIKSVNNRYLDLSIKQPRLFFYAEDSVRKQIAARIARGHLDVYVSYENTGTDRQALRLDMAVAGDYVAMAHKVSRELGVTDDLTAAALLRMPDVVVPVATDEDQERLSALLNTALSQALDGLCTMRAKEGKALVADLTMRCGTVSGIVDNIAKIAPGVVDDYRAKMTARVQELLADVPVDESRLLTEIAVYTDRVNIDEEITRMRSHIAQFDSLLHQDAAVGRKLDFLMQEMNREANTMGSKANSAALQNLVVALKNELEKMREQIQNLE